MRRLHGSFNWLEFVIEQKKGGLCVRSLNWEDGWLHRRPFLEVRKFSIVSYRCRRLALRPVAGLQRFNSRFWQQDYLWCIYPIPTAVWLRSKNAWGKAPPYRFVSCSMRETSLPCWQNRGQASNCVTTNCVISSSNSVFLWFL